MCAHQNSEVRLPTRRDLPGDYSSQISGTGIYITGGADEWHILGHQFLDPAKLGNKGREKSTACAIFALSSPTGFGILPAAPRLHFKGAFSYATRSDAFTGIRSGN
jgi:hypothetical protein